jgi:non-homologous end joining protein Ku
MPRPRGRRPSTGAFTRLGARKASEMAILTCRALHFSRVQSSATVVTRPETTSSMLDLAKHIVEQKSAHFDPSKFEDRYESTLQELLDKKQKGQPIAKMAPRTSAKVVNLMDALRESLKSTGARETSASSKKTKAKPVAKRKAG